MAERQIDAVEAFRLVMLALDGRLEDEHLEWRR